MYNIQCTQSAKFMHIVIDKNKVPKQGRYERSGAHAYVFVCHIEQSENQSENKNDWNQRKAFNVQWTFNHFHKWTLTRNSFMWYTLIALLNYKLVSFSLRCWRIQHYATILFRSDTLCQRIHRSTHSIYFLLFIFFFRRPLSCQLLLSVCILSSTWCFTIVCLVVGIYGTFHCLSSWHSLRNLRHNSMVNCKHLTKVKKLKMNF